MNDIDWNRQAGDVLKAVRAVGFMEGMSMWLWTQVGPDLDDEIAAEYDRRVADVASLLRLEARNRD